MPTHTVFYSWQSDRPNSINRGFIENCLTKAMKQISSDGELKLDPCLDRDTGGVPGSPDIAATIFTKIQRADVFIGDVTFIDDGNNRRTPNPNVLVELGFAAAHLGWENMICVFNSAFGKIDDLPFDLRQRRVRTYTLRETEEKADVRSNLVSLLKADIQGILDAPEQAEREAYQHLLSTLGIELVSIVIFGSEIEERQLNPWLTRVMSRFQSAAGTLRELATTDTAIKRSLSDEFEALADCLDEAGNYRMNSSSWPGFSSTVEQAVTRALAIKAAQIDSLPIASESLGQVRSTVKSTSRKLERLSERADKMSMEGRWEEVQQQAAEYGYLLLQMSHHKVDSILPDLSIRLRNLGRDLHLVETLLVYCDGGRSVQRIVERVQQASRGLSELAKEVEANA